MHARAAAVERYFRCVGVPGRDKSASQFSPGRPSLLGGKSCLETLSKSVSQFSLCSSLDCCPFCPRIGFMAFPPLYIGHLGRLASSFFQGAKMWFRFFPVFLEYMYIYIDIFIFLEDSAEVF